MRKTDVVERRKYLRLDSVFPVEIYLHNGPDNNKPRLVQAFTHDVSLGGLCLTVNDPDNSLLSDVGNSSVVLDVAINMPLKVKPIEAHVRVVWHEVKELKRHKQLVVGVAYDTIRPKDKNRILMSAHRIRLLPKIGAAIIVLLACLLIVSYNRSAELRAKNIDLIKRFHRVQEESELYKRSLGKIDRKHEDLMGLIAENEKKTAVLQAQLSAIPAGNAEAIKIERERLEEELAAVMSEKALFQGQLKDIVDRKEKASKLLNEVRTKKRQLEEATADNMYQWLSTHRNRFTGLVMSFEGDPAIKDWAFTYDLSLVSQVFLISGDTEKAGQILSFFKDAAKKRDGGFVNAYNVMTGAPIEEIVHIGPNTWVGIAAVRYAQQTGDKTYIELAEDIARWVMALKDKDGGVRGGPGLSWYSTEHNLDAYALFNMLYAVTKKDIYRREMERTFKWLKENTYSPKEGRLIRGKGDATIATDTLAWAVAAIGPERLMKEGMDPDAMMKFAEDHCLVSTQFTRPDGEVVNIKGFDFAKARNVARNGIVSTEWTAQMILSYKQMADFYRKLQDTAKADEYAAKAELYLNELDKMIMSSSSPSGQGAGCLPYASQPSADTGHGWRTPAGNQTGSVSGTAYTIFAKKGYNPLAPE